MPEVNFSYWEKLLSYLPRSHTMQCYRQCEHTGSFFSPPSQRQGADPRPVQQFVIIIVIISNNRLVL